MATSTAQAAGLGKRPLLGILGGMGPLATADFYNKIIENTPAKRDQDHLAVIIVADPSVPDRSAAILNGVEDPVFAALIEGVQRLESAGADAIVMPCNTAHHWLERLQRETSCPILSIIDASIAYAKQHHPSAITACVLGTRGTNRAAIYDKRLRENDYNIRPVPDDALSRTAEIIADVKGGRIQRATSRFKELLKSAEREADIFFLACTELPIIAKGLADFSSGLVDTTEALALSSIAWCGEWQSHVDATTKSIRR